VTLRYETGITTFLQLALAALFVVVGGVSDMIKSCQDGASSCVTSSFLWMVILLFVIGFFMSLTALGYFAQTKRSSRLAKLLLITELGIAAISYKLLTASSSILSTVGVFIILCLALTTVWLAWRIIRAKGRRIVASTRPPARARRPNINRTT
jgi:uncharacterized BrkB/YihY/UPF0761 family membrane protein